MRVCVCVIVHFIVKYCSLPALHPALSASFLFSLTKCVCVSMFYVNACVWVWVWVFVHFNLKYCSLLVLRPALSASFFVALRRSACVHMCVRVIYTFVCICMV